MPIVQCPSLALQACCFRPEWAGTGLASLKRKRRAFSSAYRSMPFACASGLLQVASDFPGIVCILDGD